MKTITLSANEVKIIQNILEQFWWPVKDTFPTRKFTDLTTELIMDMRDIFREAKYPKTLELNSYEYFTLIRILDFFLLRMGYDEFWTVTGLDFYKDGILLINNLRRRFIDLKSDCDNKDI